MRKIMTSRLFVICTFSICLSLTHQIICAPAAHIFSERDPWVLRIIRPVFLCGFPLQQLKCDSQQQQTEKKKVTWACKIFCQHRKKRKHAREQERKTVEYVSTERAPARCLATNRKAKVSRVAAVSQHAHIWIVFLWHNTSANTTAPPVCHLYLWCGVALQICINTSTNYQRLTSKGDIWGCELHPVWK